MNNDQSRRGLIHIVSGVASFLLALAGTRPNAAGAAEQSGKTVRVWKMGGAIDVDEAPNGADLFTMGGDIEVKSSSGEVKAKTMGGEIKLLAASGPVYATTMSGAIYVKVRQTSAGEIRLSSNGGDITLLVPKNYALNADISLAYTNNQTEQYAITTNFALHQSSSNEWDKQHGTPRKYIHATGRTGSGNANSVFIETINGNVVLKQV